MPIPLLPAAGSIIGYGAINGLMNLFNRKSQIKGNERLQSNNHAFQEDLEEKRRNMQMMQMQLSMVQQEENQAFQMELAELGHHKAQELERIRQSFQGWLAEYNNEKAKELQALGHQNALELEQFRQTVSIALNNKNLNFQKWRFEQEKIIQHKILQLQQEFQREITQIQHENALQLLQKRIRNEKSPLTFLASDLLQAPFLNGVMPLKIL